jgi:hypothetical protein
MVVAAGAVASDVCAQGATPLDEAAYADAIARGEAGEPPGNEPFVMRLLVARDAATLDLIEDAPFSFFIQTPYSTVSELAALAAAAPGDVRMLTRDEANARLVSIEVLPGRIARTADAIFHVVLRRDDREIRPVVARVVPHQVEDRAGRGQLLTAGSFSFPFRAFDDGGPLTIVFVGRRTSFEWTLTPEELRALR